jgi:hypothetical protein
MFFSTSFQYCFGPIFHFYFPAPPYWNCTLEICDLFYFCRGIPKSLPLVSEESSDFDFQTMLEQLKI